MAFLPGKNASVLVGGVSINHEQWELNGDINLIPIPHFNAQGAQVTVPGFYKGTITLSGHHDVGGMPYTLGVNYIVTLRWSPLIFLSILATCKNFVPSVKADESPTLRVEFWSQGTWIVSVP